MARAALGAPLIMGRKARESLPPRFRPLPCRTHIILTHQRGLAADSAQTVHTATRHSRCAVARPKPG
jgi:dihydrofolate reductase